MQQINSGKRKIYVNGVALSICSFTVASLPFSNVFVSFIFFFVPQILMEENENNVSSHCMNIYPKDTIVTKAFHFKKLYIKKKIIICYSYLAVVAGLCGEADYIFIPEDPPNADWPDRLCKQLSQARKIFKAERFSFRKSFESKLFLLQ